MEEVDSIILHFLKRLNIQFDEDIKNICELQVETIVESIAKCLSTINPSQKLPQKLPTGISQRIEVAAQIASLCKDLGYKNDVGYQTFLYYNEAELRQVFMFLIERLPNESKETTIKSTSANKKSLFYQDISRKVQEELNAVWIPPCCNSKSSNTVGDFIQSQAVPLATSTSMLNENEVVQKLLKMKRLKSSTEVQAEKTNQQISQEKSQPQETKIKVYDNKPLKELKEMAIVLRQKLDVLESEKNAKDVEFSQLQKRNEKADAELKNVEEILSSIGIHNIESEGATDIFEKLQKNINLLHGKNEDHTSKNLSLKAEIEKLRKNKSLTESERSKCKKILVNLKEIAKSLKNEYEKKEKLKQQLIRNYEKVKGGNKRYVYTKRILEIISNVDKQNIEIKKILDDTRQLQKEINVLEGQLERCFSIADETLFKDAKKDDQAKKAYKLLALLHSECNTIVSLVNDTGVIIRDMVDLEDNVEIEKSKRTEDTLSKMLQDLTRMQEECKEI